MLLDYKGLREKKSPLGLKKAPTETTFMTKKSNFSVFGPLTFRNSNNPRTNGKTEQ